MNTTHKPMVSDKGLYREIRISGFGDYAAIDYMDANDFGVRKVVDTPLYLKKGEMKECKIRWDCEVSSSNGTTKQNWMEDGLIKFDGKKLLLAYAKPLLGQKEIEWWEADMSELENWCILHLTTSHK